MNRLTKSVLALGVLPVIALAAGGAKSGPQVGEQLFAFEPTHVTGADKGTNTCPVCKYGATPAVQVWINDDSPENVAKIASELEKVMEHHGAKTFKAFVIDVNPKGLPSKAVAQQLQNLAEKNHLKNVAFTYLSSPKDEAVAEYKINTSPEIRNTVLVYVNRKVAKNFVNLKADDAGLQALDEAVGEILSK
jgi:protocatechuate 3,4-dioxygenase beta subunit